MDVTLCLTLCLTAFTLILATREPQCSNFNFQEKLLEKAIRSELKMESIEASIDRVTSTTDTEIKEIKGKK